MFYFFYEDAVVPQSFERSPRMLKVGVRIPFAKDFIRKNSTGYGTVMVRYDGRVRQSCHG